MPWKPSEPGAVPTLGYGVIDWISTFLNHPALEDEPYLLYREQEDFILDLYEVDPFGWNPWLRAAIGRRKRLRALLGRPRGWAKSPLLAALCLAEGMADVVPVGWDADGQPVGAPWSEFLSPLIQVAAVTEDQVATNTWGPLLRMCEGPVLDEYPGLEPLGTMVNLPRGQIQRRTAEASSIKGAPANFAVMDQTEEWFSSNGGKRLAARMRENAAKVGGVTVESPNAFIPGTGSVAEESAIVAASIRDGTALVDDLLYNVREAPADTELYERESVTLGLRVAYGDSSGHPDGCVIHDEPCPPGHVDLDAIIATMWATDYEPQDARANFLNQATHAATSWLDQPSWKARYGDSLDPPVRSIADRDVITIGFDGSRGRAKGKPDATALVGCRVSDGHVFELAVWEADGNQDHWPKWTPPLVDIEAKIADTFSRYRVAAFYADPAKDWRSYVNGWEAKYAPSTVRGDNGRQVHVTRDHPFEWWMVGGRDALIERAVKQFEGAVRNGDMTHDGSSRLTSHILNTHRDQRNGRRLKLRKATPDSPLKIDASIAAVLAWQARLDAVAAGVRESRPFVAPVRIR